MQISNYREAFTIKKLAVWPKTNTLTAIENDSWTNTAFKNKKTNNILHCVAKNVRPLTCYNFDIHYLITILFGSSVTGTEKVRNQTMLRLQPSAI